jgi:hypothetical protein
MQETHNIVYESVNYCSADDMEETLKFVVELHGEEKEISENRQAISREKFDASVRKLGEEVADMYQKMRKDAQKKE